MSSSSVIFYFISIELNKRFENTNKTVKNDVIVFWIISRILQRGDIERALTVLY